MQVFKQYFKIIRKSVFWSLFMYAFIFIVMTLLFSKTSDDNSSTFEITKCDVVIFNEDDSLLSKNLKEFVEKNSSTITIENSEESIKDSLFFRESELVITIPKGFGAAFQTETPIMLETQSIPNSTSSIFFKNIVNNYLTTTSLYLKGTAIRDFDKLNAMVQEDLSKETLVNINSASGVQEKNSTYYYFNYLAYPLLCMLILGISLITEIFNRKDIKMRNLCSPITLRKFNIQLFLGHALLAFSIWTIFIVISFIMYSSQMSTLTGVLYIINSLIFTLTALSLSFFVGNIATKNSISAICNCVAIGSCFLGGAFVPQEMLSPFIIKLSIINPVYWYIKINNTVSGISNFSFQSLKPIIFEFLILIAFSLAFLSIGLVTIKEKSLKATNE